MNDLISDPLMLFYLEGFVLMIFILTLAYPNLKDSFKRTAKKTAKTRIVS